MKQQEKRLGDSVCLAMRAGVIEFELSTGRSAARVPVIAHSVALQLFEASSYIGHDCFR